MKKQIFTILLTITILISFISIFPITQKEAKAFLFPDPLQAIKEWVVDALPKTVARHMVVRLQQEIARWAQGGFTDENKPFAMISWKQEVKEALQIASGEFIRKYNLTQLCSPFKISLGTALGIGMPGGSVPYEVYGACTLGNIVDNVEEFFKNPSIALYGWDSWTALTQPNNNFFGSLSMAQAEKTRLEEEEITEKEKEVEAGQGIKNETICNKTDQQACAANCNQYPATVNALPNPIYVACMKSCEKSSIGVCLEKTTIKLGSEIRASVDKMIGSDVDWLISADEITEMLNLVFSGLFNKLTHGINGLLTKGSSSTTTISKNQEDYAYYKDYKKTLTPQDITKLKGDILTNILRSVQSVSAVGYACDKDEQIKGEVYSEMVADIINEEAQHLYTSMEGINLKPDFEVLDNQAAVDNKIAIYGRTWDDVPFKKYPEKCASIANKKCSDILTGLPYELSITKINSECATGCLGQIDNYRKECLGIFNECEYKCENQACKNTCHSAYTTCRETAKTKAVADKKCSTLTIANACLDGRALITKTTNSCDSCIKKYEDSCALKETQKEKDDCVKEGCGDYEDISTSIKSAQDFYDRCALNEIKYSCEVCLKEYFMPAEYCGEIHDFIERAFVKYPALVYHDTWWGRSTKFSDDENCIEHTPLGHKYLSTAVTCRILPDFIFPGGGTCETLCDVTTEELRNTVDHEPREAECTGPLKDPAHPEWGGVWESGGYPAGSQFTDYLVNKRTACCAVLVGHNKESYQRCRGISSEVTVSEGWCAGLGTKGYEKKPECYCDEGERFIGETATSWKPLFKCPDPSGFCYQSKTEQTEVTRTGCSNLSFKVPNMKYINTVSITTNPAPGGSIITIAPSGCNDPDASNCVVGSNSPIDSCDYIGTPPSNPIPGDGPGNLCQIETKNRQGSEFCSESIPSTKISGNGKETLVCNLSNYIGDNLSLSVVSDEKTDCKTTAGFCVRCDPSDQGYPNYGYETNQCDNKIPQELR